MTHTDLKERTLGHDRMRFEAWVKRKHPERWPNPHTTQPDVFVRDNGDYHNFLLQAMWQAWQAWQEWQP